MVPYRPRPRVDYNFRPGDICGIIKNIKIVNFMCHSNLNVDLGPNVNFISGRNGCKGSSFNYVTQFEKCEAGKSAILTALVLGLGGRASTMGRGSSMKNYVKTGSPSALIKITLSNRGLEAYKPEEYGNEIVVERRITAGGSGGGYALKNSTGKLVSDKKEDLVRILDRFNIQVDNPMNILTQDVAKTFLHKLNFSELYQVLDAMKEEVGNLEAKIQAHRNMKKDRERLRYLGGELCWARVRDAEKELERFEAHVATAEERMSNYKEQCEAMTEKKAEASENAEKLKAEVGEFIRHMGELRVESDRKKRAYDEENDKVRTQQRLVQRIEREIEVQKAACHAVQKQIDTNKKRADQEDQGKIEEEKVRREIETQEQKKEQIKAEVEAAREEMERVRRDFNSRKVEHNEQKQLLSAIQSDCSQNQREMDRLKSAGSDQLRRYGNEYPTLVQLIKKNGRKFKKVPRGPLGCEVKLKDKKWLVAVEKALQNSLKSFACDNWDDARLLQQLMVQAGFRGNYRPNVIVTKFHDRKHNIAQHAPRQRSTNYPTVLSVLEIKDTVAFNVLVDQCNIESILLIEDVEEMNSYMRDRPDGGVISAYSPQGHQCYPKPKFRMYSFDARRRTANLLAQSAEESIGEFQSVLDDLNTRYQVLDPKVAELKRTLDQMEKFIREKEQNISKNEKVKLNLSQSVERLKDRLEKLLQENEQDDLNILQQELLRQEQEIEKNKEKKAIEEELVKQMEAVVEEKRKEFDSAKEEQKRKSSQELDRLEKEYQEAKDELGRLVRKLEKGQKKLKDYEELVAETGRLEKEEEKNRHVTSAQEIQEERVETEREVEIINEDLRQTKHRIEQGEKQIGDIEEVVALYKEKNKTFNSVKGEVEAMTDLLKVLEEALNHRSSGFRWMKTVLGLLMRSKFANLVGLRSGYCGRMWISERRKKLILAVETETSGGPIGGDPQRHSLIKLSTERKSLTKGEAENRNLKNLSGGERSFTMVSFILAMWEAMEFPFRCMDEFDVFMDMIARRLATDTLVDFGTQEKQRHYQFIYLTPLDISHLKKDANLKVFRLMDPRQDLFGNNST